MKGKEQVAGPCMCRQYTRGCKDHWLVDPHANINQMPTHDKLACRMQRKYCWKNPCNETIQGCKFSTGFLLQKSLKGKFVRWENSVIERKIILIFRVAYSYHFLWGKKGIESPWWEDFDFQWGRNSGFLPTTETEICGVWNLWLHKHTLWFVSSPGL